MAEPIVCFSKGHGYGLGQVTQHSTYNFVVELESFSVGLQCVCHLGGGSCTLFMGQDLAGGDLKDSALTPCITQRRAAKLKRMAEHQLLSKHKRLGWSGGKEPGFISPAFHSLLSKSKWSGDGKGCDDEGHPSQPVGTGFAQPVPSSFSLRTSCKLFSFRYWSNSNLSVTVEPPSIKKRESCKR